MSELKIVTNNIPRELVSLASLPSEFANDFDYLEGNLAYENRIVKFKGHYYDVDDSQCICVESGKPMGVAMVVAPDHPFAKWDCVVSESFFSGVLFRLNGNGKVVCGSYYS